MGSEDLRTPTELTEDEVRKISCHDASTRRSPALTTYLITSAIFGEWLSLYSLPRGRFNEAEKVISARYSMPLGTRILSEISALPNSFFRYHLKELLGNADIEDALNRRSSHRGSAFLLHGDR